MFEEYNEDIKGRAEHVPTLAHMVKNKKYVMGTPGSQLNHTVVSYPCRLTLFIFILLRANAIF